MMPATSRTTEPEWFATPDPERDSDGSGLRFSCTTCGNCCSGPSGYVVVSDAEALALAARLEITLEAFIERYTHHTPQGRSLNEKPSHAGLDCVFLDREKIPGKAVCGVYEDRPIQCRTWPFWPSVIKSRKAWEQAKGACPGMDHGKKYDLVQIRVARDAFKI